VKVLPFLLILCLLNLNTPAQIYPLPERIPRVDLEIIQQSNEKLTWLMDGKFGMFLHWGLYSGAENGEWYMNWAGIPINEYRKFAIPKVAINNLLPIALMPMNGRSLQKMQG